MSFGTDLVKRKINFFYIYFHSILALFEIKIILQIFSFSLLHLSQNRNKYNSALKAMVLILFNYFKINIYKCWSVSLINFERWNSRIYITHARRFLAFMILFLFKSVNIIRSEGIFFLLLLITQSRIFKYQHLMDFYNYNDLIFVSIMGIFQFFFSIIFIDLNIFAFVQ